MQKENFDNWDSFIEKFEYEAKDNESTWLEITQFTERDQDYIKFHIFSIISASEKSGEYPGWSETAKFNNVFKNIHLNENFMLILWYKLFEKYCAEWVEFETSISNLIYNPAFDKLLVNGIIDTLLSLVKNTPPYVNAWKKQELIARKIAESESLSNEARKVILLREDSDTLYLSAWVARCESTPATLLATALEENKILRTSFDTLGDHFKDKSIQGAREKYSIDETVPDYWVAKTMNWGNINEH